MHRRSEPNHAAFTIFELIVVIGIIAVLGSLAVPSIRATVSHQRLKGQAFDLNSALERARSEAIRSGNNFIVFVGTDTLGGSLADSASNPVPVLILDDGRPGSATQNCLIDSGEPIQWLDPASGIAGGVVGSPGNAPSDLGAGDITTGSSFEDGGGTDTTWVMFRADGAPVGFNTACVQSGLGSGAGAFYLQNSARTAAVTVSPTGNIRVHLHRSSWSQ